MAPRSWRSTIADAAERLASALDARRIAEEVSGREPASLLALLDDPVGDQDAARFGELVERRRSGEPLQHVLGHWSFRTLELVVDPRALVPRPETELVAGYALSELARRRAGRPVAEWLGQAPPLLAVDLGTGSGALACALVTEASDVRVVAVDSSREALALAAANRSMLGEEAAVRLDLVEGDWYGALDARSRGAVDCVVANPPYLAASEWPGLEPVVRDHDPYGALVAGPTGFEAIEQVVSGAPRVLAPGGAIVVEIAPHQAGAALALALATGASFAEVAKDLAGRDRILVARYAPVVASEHRGGESRC